MGKGRNLVRGLGKLVDLIISEASAGERGTQGWIYKLET